jgi:excinuclease ABC subunit C
MGKHPCQRISIRYAVFGGLVTNFGGIGLGLLAGQLTTVGAWPPSALGVTLPRRHAGEGHERGGPTRGGYLSGGFGLAIGRGGVMRRNGPAVIGQLPCAPGVYRFRDAAGRVLYVGRATTLRSRVASYWSDLRDRQHLAPMVARVARIEAVACDSAHEAAWLERNLLETSLPRWNLTAGGQESAVYIKMDTRPAAPGLYVAYQAEPAAHVRHFGPYLGRQRVRRAVTALDRLLPLSYTGTRLSGTERDIAQARGAVSTDRSALIRSLTAILAREPAAVSRARGRLEGLRDRAAGLLAYEMAARIQDEIAALEWVTCPQRVTTMEPASCTVSGWCSGILVQFQISGGRVRSWSQRACSMPGAAGALAATPHGWGEFMQRTAELAATIAPAHPKRTSGP